MNSLQNAFEELVQEMYSMENMLVDALPKVAQAAQSEDLKQAVLSHLEETREHSTRLGEVAQTCQFTTLGREHRAVREMIAEADQVIGEYEPGPLRDSLLILCARKVEHCEMACYGTAISWAKTLELDDCADLLDDTLDEERDADKKLTSIGEDILKDASKEGAFVGGDEKRTYLG